MPRVGAGSYAGAVTDSRATPPGPDQTTDPAAGAALRVVDLSHTIRAGLITYPGLPAPVITPHLTREASRATYAPGTGFAMDVITMIGNPADWTAHRRDDGELVGWIRPDGDHWAAIDLLGREVAASVDWLDAEAALEERGLGYLADVWMLERGGGAVRVRMVEVTPARIVVKVDDFGDVSHATERIVLPWPIPAQLRAPRPGDPDGFTVGRPAVG